MSLDYNLTGITDENRAKYPATPEGRMNHVTERLIFGCMITGIGEITEKTEAEYYGRLHMIEMMGSRVADLTTPADVHAHIGLSTNVFPMDTRAAWIKRVMGGQLRDFVWDYTRAMERAAAEATEATEAGTVAP